MPRSLHEPSRDSAARATDSRSDRAADARSDTGRDDTAPDEGLGLLPTGETATDRAEVIDEETDLTTTPHRLDGPDAALPDLEPSLTDQEILDDPMAASGGADDLVDPVAEGDEVYVPPTDPVVATGAHGETRCSAGSARMQAPRRHPAARHQTARSATRRWSMRSSQPSATMPPPPISSWT